MLEWETSWKDAVFTSQLKAEGIMCAKRLRKTVSICQRDA